MDNAKLFKIFLILHISDHYEVAAYVKKKKMSVYNTYVHRGMFVCLERLSSGTFATFIWTAQ